MDNAQLINQDSGDYEYSTPPEIIEAARKVMGTIDLDPASSFSANKIVKSEIIYDKEYDGLKQLWYGNVWMNHPFSRSETPCKVDCKKKICQKRGYHTTVFIPGNREWIEKAVKEYRSGRAEQLTCITYASTSEDWFRPLTAFPQCYLTPRTNYYLPDGTKKKGVTKGSVVTYMGPNVELFKKAFKGMGWFSG